MPLYRSRQALGHHATDTDPLFSGLGSADQNFGPNSATWPVMAQSGPVQDLLNQYYMTGATHDLNSFGGPGWNLGLAKLGALYSLLSGHFGLNPPKPIARPVAGAVMAKFQLHCNTAPLKSVTNLNLFPNPSTFNHLSRSPRPPHFSRL